MINEEPYNGCIDRKIQILTLNYINNCLIITTKHEACIESALHAVNKYNGKFGKKST